MFTQYLILLCFLLALARTEPIKTYKLVFRGQSFDFVLYCKATPFLCRKMEQALQSADWRIADDFAIRQRIRVVAKLLPKCVNVTQAECAGKDFNAMPVAWVPVIHTDDSETYMYPTSLLKQLDYEGADRIKWPANDIQFELSSSGSWWLQDNPEVHQIEDYLETAVLSALIHGMGFGDTRTFHSTMRSQSLVLPLPRFETAPYLELSQSHNHWTIYPIAGWAFPSIWDRFTYLGGIRSTKWLGKMQICFKDYKYGRSSLWMPRNFFNEASILEDNCTIRVASEIYRLVSTPGALKFDFGAWPSGQPDRNRVILDTYNQGFVQVDLNLQNALSRSEEFILLPASDSELTFQQYNARFRAPPSGIERGIRDIMLALGYCPSQGNCASRYQHAFVDSYYQEKKFPNPSSTNFWEKTLDWFKRTF